MTFQNSPAGDTNVSKHWTPNEWTKQANLSIQDWRASRTSRPPRTPTPDLPGPSGVPNLSWALGVVWGVVEGSWRIVAGSWDGLGVSGGSWGRGDVTWGGDWWLSRQTSEGVGEQCCVTSTWVRWCWLQPAIITCLPLLILCPLLCLALCACLSVLPSIIRSLHVLFMFLFFSFFSFFSFFFLGT